MATVSRYETGKGDRRWEVRFRTPEGGSTRKRGFATKADAQRFAAGVEVKKLRGEFVAAAAGRVTIGELGPVWLASKRGGMKPSAWRTLDSAWRVRVEPRWGRVAVGDVKPSAVATWLAELTAGDPTRGVRPVGATTVLRTHQVVHGILAAAVDDGMVSRNPAAVKRNTLPKKTRKRSVYLSHAEVDALAEAAGDHGPPVQFLCATGLRWGEATGLRVRDLDLLRGSAAIHENAVRIGGAVVVGSTKGGKSRDVPLPRFLREDLAAACVGKGRDELVWGDGVNHVRPPRSGNGWLERAVRAAGVPRVTAHDLRHTAASLAVSAGANVKAVQRMLGHASAAMTLDVYADLFDDDLDAVAAAMDTARARSRETACGQNVSTVGSWRREATS